jgi:hypothetical protein
MKLFANSPRVENGFTQMLSFQITNFSGLSTMKHLTAMVTTVITTTMTTTDLGTADLDIILGYGLPPCPRVRLARVRELGFDP